MTSSSPSPLTPPPRTEALNFINGKYVSPSTNAFQDLFSPLTGEKMGRVALSGAKDVDDAVLAASAAFEKWGKLTYKARSQYIFKLRQLIIDHQETLCEIVMMEHGKTRGEAIGSIQKGNETCEWACTIPSVAQGRIQEVSTGVQCHETREALGVVASIVPFNFPIMVPMWTLPIAIATGNCIIIKPSEKVPLTLNFLTHIIRLAGIPDGVVNFVHGTVDVVNRLCDHPDIKALSFVGSSKVAQIVATRCHSINKRVLALGAAKNHIVALNDCNVDMASTDIVVSYSGCAGERCMAASVCLLVGEQKELLQQICDKSLKLKPGQGSGEMGPLIDQLALQRVTKYINEAEKGGAKILVDGRSWTKEHPKGFWIGPTVILHTNPADAALHEEIFGPVLSVLIVENKEKAIEIENKSAYGNAAAIYTTVGAHAEWFVKRFNAGMIGVGVGVPVPREPFSFGGWNASRFGDSSDITGEGGLQFWTKKRKITTKWVPPPSKGDGDWMS